MEIEKPPTNVFGDAPYRMLVAQIKDFAVFHLDLEGRIQSWNAGAAHLSGYAASEVIGQPFAMLFTPEDRQNGVPERELKTAAESGQAEDVRWHQRKDGTRFFANGVTTSLHDEQGSLRGFAKVARDDTARHQGELDVKASEIRYRRLFEAAFDGILILNVETGQIADVNPYLCKLLEYSHKELSERNSGKSGCSRIRMKAKPRFESCRRIVIFVTKACRSKPKAARAGRLSLSVTSIGKTGIASFNATSVTSPNESAWRLSANNC